jgi:aminoglycoside phosphotransferase (APT) family kinase protein
MQRLPDIIFIDTLENSGPLACVIHGDYRINNMLFKYSDESQIEDVETSPSIPISLKMIDFQQSRIGHPLNDILYRGSD